MEAMINLGATGGYGNILPGPRAIVIMIYHKTLHNFFHLYYYNAIVV